MSAWQLARPLHTPRSLAGDGVEAWFFGGRLAVAMVMPTGPTSSPRWNPQYTCGWPCRFHLGLGLVLWTLRIWGIPGKRRWAFQLSIRRQEEPSPGVWHEWALRGSPMLPPCSSPRSAQCTGVNGRWDGRAPPWLCWHDRILAGDTLVAWLHLSAYSSSDHGLRCHRTYGIRGQNLIERTG